MRTEAILCLLAMALKKFMHTQHQEKNVNNKNLMNLFQYAAHEVSLGILNKRRMSVCKYLVYA